MGGNRFTTPDQEQSAIHEMVVLDESKAFEWQESNKFFADIALSYCINRQNKAHIFAIQAKNVLMQSEMSGWAYDFKKQKVTEHEITMVYPYFSYKLEFKKDHQTFWDIHYIILTNKHIQNILQNYLH